MGAGTRCNWHSYEQIIRANPDAQLKPAASTMWPLAKELVNAKGETIVWFAELPEGCHCG